MGFMRKFFKWLYDKLIGRRNKQIEEAEAKIKEHEKLEKLKRRFQEKKNELDHLKHDKS